MVKSILQMLVEATITKISKEKKPKTFSKSKAIAKKGGDTTEKARKDIE